MNPQNFEKAILPALFALMLIPAGCSRQPEGYDTKAGYSVDALKEELAFRYSGMIAKGKATQAKPAAAKKSFDAPEQREANVEETKAEPDETPAGLVREILSKADQIPGQNAEKLKAELVEFVKSTDRIPPDKKAPLLDVLGSN